MSHSEIDSFRRIFHSKHLGFFPRRSNEESFQIVRANGRAFSRNLQSANYRCFIASSSRLSP